MLLEEREYFKGSWKTTLALLASVAFVTLFQKVVLWAFIRYQLINDSSDYFLKYLITIFSVLFGYSIIGLLVHFDTYIDSINFFKKIADIRLVIYLVLLIPASKRYFLEVSGSLIDRSSAFITIIFLLVTCYIIERTLVSAVSAYISYKARIPLHMRFSPELYLDVMYIPLSYLQNMFIGVSIALFTILIVTMLVWGSEVPSGIAFVNEVSDFLYHIYMFPL